MVQAWAGFNSVNGTPEGGPVRLGIPMVDLGTGLHLAVGILMALLERHRSGRGQFLEVTLYDAAVSLQHPHATNWLGGEMTPEQVGNAHPTLAPYDQFRTRGRNVVTGAGNDAQFRRLCTIIGRPDMADDSRSRLKRIGRRTVWLSRKRSITPCRSETASNWLWSRCALVCPPGPVAL
jgi:crotonobetainyl-CoA:carnitine CoA-transferase CaiB-like acyl-CoA transferase